MVCFDERRVEFHSSTAACRGVLLTPPGGGTSPAVVMCAGFAGTQGTPAIRAAAQAFCRAGFVVLTFDYRRLGVSDGEPRQVIDLADQRRDIAAAIDFVSRRAEVDAARIALWGTSLGGGHVTVVAAGRRDIAAVIAQVPFNGFPRRVEGRSAAATIRLLSAMAVDRMRGLLRLPPYYIAAVGAPGSTAVMTSRAAERAVALLDGAGWTNTVAPRVLFAMMRYHPGASAGSVSAPLLVCAATEDRETPLASVADIARRAPQGCLHTYPVSHFDVYDATVRRRLIADQIAFLESVLR
jgi:alpha-beta hydrolase superfamily lysophospholipase